MPKHLGMTANAIFRPSRLRQLRQDVQSLLAMREYLSVSDRALLRHVYEFGTNATALGRATGVDPKHIRRRLRRLIKRVADPVFRYVMANRQGWADERRAIAESVILRGNTMRAAAASLRISVYIVRREIDRIRTESHWSASHN